MAEVSSPTTHPTQGSVFKRLWQRWLARRRRNQARFLSYGSFRLTREGIHFLGVLLFVFLGAVIREINLLILIAGSMIGLLVLQWRFNSRTLIGLTLKRRLPHHFSVQRSANVELSVSNPKRWLGSWLVVVEDRMQKLEPEATKLSGTGMAIFEEIRPRGQASSHYQVDFHQRGRYRLGPSVISTRFPLGLGRGWRTLDNACDVIVHPQLGELTPKVKSLFQLRREGQATTSPKAGAHEADFYGLRPWQSGDSKRWIHWRTTARLGEVAVRQFERMQQRQICVLLDLYCRNGASIEEVNRCELAISFLATLATTTAKQGADKVAAAVAGKEVVSQGNMQSNILASQLLDGLATVKPCGTPKLKEAFAKLMTPLVSNPVLLVVSTRASQVEQLRAEIVDSVGMKLFSKLHIRWLDVSADELAPYFHWSPVMSDPAIVAAEATAVVDDSAVRGAGETVEQRS